MLDRLELLLPIPTGAKMDRWRKMVIQRIERKKDEVKGEERDKNAQETFSCIMYTDKVSNMVFIMTPSLERNTSAALYCSLIEVVGHQHNSIESETYMTGIAPLQLHFRVPHERILHFQFPHLEKVKKVFERGFSIRRPHNVCGFVL